MLLRNDRLYTNQSPRFTNSERWIGVAHGVIGYDNDDHGDFTEIITAIVPTWAYYNTYDQSNASYDNLPIYGRNKKPYPISWNDDRTIVTINGFDFTPEQLNVASVIVDTEPVFESYFTMIDTINNVQLTFQIDIPEKYFVYDQEIYDAALKPVRYDMEKNPVATVEGMTLNVPFNIYLSNKTVTLDIGDRTYRIFGSMSKLLEVMLGNIDWMHSGVRNCNSLNSRKRSAQRVIKLSFKYDFNTFDGTIVEL